MYSSRVCPQRNACNQEKLWVQFPLKWNFMQISLPYAPFETLMPPLFVSQKNSLNISANLRRGSKSGFLSSSLCLCCPKFSLHDPLLPATPPLFDLIFPSFFCAGISIQVGGTVIHSPLSTRLCISPNFPRSHIYTSSIDVVLQLWRNILTCLWIQSTISAPKRQCPAKALSY